MQGLSISAVGLRPLAQVLNIYDVLQPELNLDYLEIAVGSVNEIDADYPRTNLVLHDNCLHQNKRRLYLEKHPQLYAEFAGRHDVLAVHWHAPLRKDCGSIAELRERYDRLRDFLGLPLYLECMATPDYWLSTVQECQDVERPLLVDVSHVHIWTRGNYSLAQQQVQTLLETCEVGCIHLSHNAGHRDSHDLIPPGFWNLEWGERLVTYESLPQSHSQYERLDRKRRS